VRRSLCTKIFTSKVCPCFSFPGTTTFCSETSPPRCAPNGTTSTLTPNERAATTACNASPVVWLPSENTTIRRCPVSGKAAVANRTAPARSVPDEEITACTRCKSTAELTDDSIAASAPNTTTPPLSSRFFADDDRLTNSRAPS
jgi:hypothetical protein